ncbi:MAG: nicotinate (nicotinamide) nucleotide adenylyltransferase [Cetobacterium sp.]
MKIGIYGGSFNPIHNGHISIARLVLKELKLDKLLIIPVGSPSHRENSLIDGSIRIKMCEIAFENDEKIEVSDLEVNSEKLSYTYDTLLKVIQKYPNSEYYEILGEDSWAYFDKWKNYEEILKLSKVVVLARDGYKGDLVHKNLIQMNNILLNYSSSEVRYALLENKNIDKMLPKELCEFIKTRNLYKKQKEVE